MNRFHAIQRFFLVGALIVVVVGCDHAPDDSSSALGPVGWWTFDEGVGVTTADASGNGNTAQLRNGGWGPGKKGAGLAMDGGNDGIVTIAMSDSLRATADAITVMGWARRTASHNVALVSHGYPELFLGFHGPRFKWQIENVHGKKAPCYADPKYVASLDRWYHVAGTYDGRTARLYVDGEEICSTWLWRGGAIKLSDGPFTISGYLDQDGKIVDEITGAVDDVRIYARALRAEEIKAIAAAGGG